MGSRHRQNKSVDADDDITATNQRIGRGSAFIVSFMVDGHRQVIVAQVVAFLAEQEHTAVRMKVDNSRRQF